MGAETLFYDEKYAKLKNIAKIKAYIIYALIIILILSISLSLRYISLQRKEISQTRQILLQQSSVQKPAHATQQLQQIDQLPFREAQQLQYAVQAQEQDNLMLRQTIQQTMSNRGAKPKHYMTTPPREALEPIVKKQYLGIWKITWYTPSDDKCSNNDGITASSQPVNPGYDIAVDCSYWGFGTKFYVEGWGLVHAEDTGNDIKGPDQADICILNKDMAKKLGMQHRRVWLVQ